jgi:hypothetical protein
MQEVGTYVNDIGAKSRLLSTKIGTNPRAVAEGESTLWEAMSELHTELKILGQASNGLPKELKGAMNDLERQKVDYQQLDANMTKMYKHYKGHLTSSNSRMISLKQGALNLKYAPMAQVREGEFDFGEEKESMTFVRGEIQELRNKIAEMSNKPGISQATTSESASGNPIFTYKQLSRNYV